MRLTVIISFRTGIFGVYTFPHVPLPILQVQMKSHQCNLQYWQSKNARDGQKDEGQTNQVGLCLLSSQFLYLTSIHFTHRTDIPSVFFTKILPVFFKICSRQECWTEEQTQKTATICSPFRKYTNSLH